MVHIMDDDKVYEFYDDPENIKIVPGEGRSRTRRGLTSHVPIRFSPEILNAARRLASQDGMSISAWIRTLVEREIERRQPAGATIATRAIVIGFPEPATKTASQEFDLAYG